MENHYLKEIIKLLAERIVILTKNNSLIPLLLKIENLSQRNTHFQESLILIDNFFKQNYFKNSENEELILDLDCQAQKLKEAVLGLKEKLA
jgi:hypothetical protein